MGNVEVVYMGRNQLFGGGVGRRGWRFLIETGKIISLLSL